MVTAIAAVAATIASEVVSRLVGKRLVLTIIEIEQGQLLSILLNSDPNRG